MAKKWSFLWRGRPSGHTLRIQVASYVKDVNPPEEFQEAADAGWNAVGQTVFESMFGGKETAGIVERNPDAPSTLRYDYKLIPAFENIHAG